MAGSFLPWAPFIDTTVNVNRNSVGQEVGEGVGHAGSLAGFAALGNARAGCMGLYSRAATCRYSTRAADARRSDSGGQARSARPTAGVSIRAVTMAAGVRPGERFG